MEYNYTEIGFRVRDERKRCGLSQDGIIEKLSNMGIPVGRNTISNLENGIVGKELPLKLLLGLCDLFDCEIGYLLCEKGYENSRTREIADIKTFTGLSDDAVKTLQEYRISGWFEHDNSIGLALSCLLHPDHCKRNDGGLLHLISAYLFSDGFSVDGLADHIHTTGTNGSGFEMKTADVIRAAIPNMVLQKLEEYRQEIRNKK